MEEKILNYFQSSGRYYVKATPVMDETGKVVDLELHDINAAFLSFLKMEKEEVLGRHLSEVFPSIAGEDALEWMHVMHEALKTKQVISKEFYSDLLENWINMEAFEEEGMLYMFIVDQNHLYKKLENYKKLTDFSLKYLEFEYGNLDYQLISDNLLEVVNAEYVFITYFDYEANKVKLKAASGMPEMLDRLERICDRPFLEFEWPMNYFNEPTVLEGMIKLQPSQLYQILGIEDEQTQKMLSRSNRIGYTYIAYITYQNQVLGNIFVVLPPNGRNSNMEILSPFCSQLGILILRKKAEEEILYLNFHDKLTGLYNRRFFEEEMKRLDTPRQIPLSIIMGDANGLKLVNDAFGHGEGDRFLKRIAQIMKDTCRTDDIVARIGGDEFVILLPNVGYKEALEIMYRIKVACEKEQKLPIKLTIAMGAATKDFEEQNIEDVFKLAEDRMYSHKIAESKQIKEAIINDLIQRLHTAFPEKKRHVKKLIELSRGLYKYLELSEIDKRDLEVLCRVHDLGNIALQPNEIPQKRELLRRERKYLKLHSEIGFRIAASSIEYANIAEYILKHHEKWDGTGFPMGIKGQDIPLVVRVFSMVDFCETYLTEHAEGSSNSLKQLKVEMKKRSGRDFDPALTEKMVLFIENEMEDQQE